MSSHHIIRENQEPALILMTEIHESLLSQLCEWNPKIACMNSLIYWAQSMQLKIDVVFGPANEKEAVLKLMAYQMPLEYLTVDKPKQLSAVINAIDNRTIHIAGNLDLSGLLKTESKEIIHFSDSFKSYRYSKSWRKWKNKDDYLEVDDEDLYHRINLEPFADGFKVPENGRCEIHSRASGIIREYHSF